MLKNKKSYDTREILVKEKSTVDTKMTVLQIAFEGAKTMVIFRRNVSSYIMSISIQISKFSKLL